MLRTTGSTAKDDCSRHEAFVRSLLEEDPTRKTKGFRGTIEKLAEDQLDLAWVRVVPDAYQASAGLVIAFEVEDTHRVDRTKLRVYGRLWAEFDSIGWEFRLVIIDIRGGRLEPNLSEVYYLNH